MHGVIDHPQAAEIVTRWVDRASQLAPRDARSVPRPQVRQAARSFRYARNLLAAEELDAWLVACDVSTEGWQDVLCRQLLAEPDVPEGTDEPDPELL